MKPRHRYVIAQSWLAMNYTIVDTDACPVAEKCAIPMPRVEPWDPARAQELGLVEARRMCEMLNRDEEMREQIDAAKPKAKQ